MAPSEIQSRRRPPALRPSAVRDARRADDVADAVNCVRLLVRGLRLAEQRTRLTTGLSAAQLFLLRHLSAAGAASLSDLAERTLTDRSSVAAVVERLEAAGLAATSRDPDDRRRVLVRITPEGERVNRAAPAAPTTMLLSALESLSADEVRNVCTALGRLNAAMGITGTPGMLFEDRPDGEGA